MSAMELSATVLRTVVDDGNGGRLERWVVVDGRGGRRKIASLSDVFEEPVAEGRYWIDPASGAFGYDGDPSPRGQIRICFEGLCFRV